jgi:hypothetical protein
MSGMTPKLYRENMIVLCVVQALWGALSPNMKAVTLEFPGDDVVVHFLLHQESSTDREEIEEEFPTEVAVLAIGFPEVGDIGVSTKIELVEHHEPRFRPPGRPVIIHRD